MSSILIGILAVLVGVLFCFRGVLAMRIVITIWGAFAGLNFGAALVAAITGKEVFDGALGWIVGIAFALLFGLLAYLYYAVAVTLVMASVGFALGAAAMVALNVTWNWVIILVGIVVGILLAVFALAVDLPSILLIVVSALGGATVTVGGLMLLTSTIETNDLNHATLTKTVADHWWWYVIYLVLLIAGIVTQARFVSRESDLRQLW